MCAPDQPWARSSRPSPTLISGKMSSKPSVFLLLATAPLATARSTNLAFASLTNMGCRSRPCSNSPQRLMVSARSCCTGNCLDTSISKSPAPTAGSRNVPNEAIGSWEGCSAVARRSELLKKAPCSLLICSGMVFRSAAPACPSRSPGGTDAVWQLTPRFRAADMVKEKYGVRLTWEQREQLQHLVPGGERLSPGDRPGPGFLLKTDWNAPQQT